MEKADRDLEAQLSGDAIDDSQLISFKVPITRLSYYNPTDDWERIEGSIEIGNVYYKYVKRRIRDDSLEVLCIPNHKAMSLQAMKRQASHPATCKIPSPEPYVFVPMGSIAPSFVTLRCTPFYYSVYLPFPPRLTEERPPAFTV
jgi:hypothetical protein